ncbi:MAG: HAD-IIA family hydrolase [Acidimicrobiales bacterium]|jgi:HAD superfamily hydrolase (TIGR01450 family)
MSSNPPSDPACVLRPLDRVFGGYALDLDGTVYLGDELLAGAQATVAAIRRNGAKTVFLTNKPLESAAAYAAKLTRLGIPADEADVLSPLGVLCDYLSEHHAGDGVLTVAEPLVDETLRSCGIEVTTDPRAAGVVVVSFDRTFDYDKLLRAFRAVRHHGAAIVATNPDPFCPTPDGGLPDCAAMLAAIEACTGSRAEAIVGKPSRHMAEALLSRLGVSRADAVVVGDRLGTDVAMAQTIGLASVLVLSGVTGPDELRAAGIRPDYVVNGIGELLSVLEGAR